MRGKRNGLPRDTLPAGITPADAGKTFLSALSKNGAQDHPRGCGENQKIRVPLIGTLGSPPRMRGKPSGITGVTTEKRITPADAGKTVYLTPAA